MLWYVVVVIIIINIVVLSLHKQPIVFKLTDNTTDDVVSGSNKRDVDIEEILCDCFCLCENTYFVSVVVLLWLCCVRRQPLPVR